MNASATEDVGLPNDTLPIVGFNVRMSVVDRAAGLFV